RAPLARPRPHPVGVGAVGSPALLRALEVVGAAEALLHDPGGPAAQDLLDVAPPERPIGVAEAGRDALEQGVGERARAAPQLPRLEIGGEQAHAAVDVEPHAAGDTTPPASTSVAATPPMGKP